jgi:hypothetical protein
VKAIWNAEITAGHTLGNWLITQFIIHAVMATLMGVLFVVATDVIHLWHIPLFTTVGGVLSFGTTLSFEVAAVLTVQRWLGVRAGALLLGLVAYGSGVGVRHLSELLPPVLSVLAFCAWTGCLFAMREGNQVLLDGVIWAFKAVLPTSSPIVGVPGSKCRRVLAFIYTTKTMSRVFDQHLSEMQDEWMAATVANRPWLAGWVRVRGYFILAKMVFLHSFVGIVQTVVEMWAALKG